MWALTKNTDEDARTMAGKYLKKYRPTFMETATQALEGGGANEGSAAAPAAVAT